MKMNLWKVYIPGKYKDILIDEVYFDLSYTAEEVKKSLIEHDGYKWNIFVELS
jgi:hypothetical protein